MDDLMRILEDCCPDIDFACQDRLIDDEVLSSLDIVMIVGELNDFFGIDITVDDLTPENFNSTPAMYQLICRLRGE